jgi:hypothetical protein
MKRVERAVDYAEFIIRAKMTLRNIEKAMNEGNLDVAQFMANELKITAMLMNDAIAREELLRSRP